MIHLIVTTFVTHGTIRKMLSTLHYENSSLQALEVLIHDQPTLPQKYSAEAYTEIIWTVFHKQLEIQQL